MTGQKIFVGVFLVLDSWTSKNLTNYLLGQARSVCLILFPKRKDHSFLLLTRVVLNFTFFSFYFDWFFNQ